MKRLDFALQNWHAKIGQGLKADTLLRGGILLIGLLIILRIAQLVNPSYPIAPVAVVLAAATGLQALCFFLLRRDRLLVPLGWLLPVTDVVVVSLVVYFTGGVESIFFWAYLVVILWWGYKTGVTGAIIAGVASLTSFWLFNGLELGGSVPHYQLLPMAASFYQNPALVGSIIAVYSLSIPLTIFVGTYLYAIRLRESSRSAYLEGMQAFVAAVEAKDPCTKGHSERVAHYAVVVAQELGLKGKEIALIRNAGLLHDAGKVFLPEDVLTARGPLEPGQQVAMMSHPVLSYEVLRRFSVSEDLLLAIRHHHEWYGGGGYPDGLSGERIPLAARILAVADAFEAMTAGRVYRSRHSIPEASKKLITGKGTQFDPRVVDAFLRRLQREVPTRLPEEAPAPAEMEWPLAPLARRQPTWTEGMVTVTQYDASTILFRLGQEVRSILDRNTLLIRILSLLQEVRGYENCAIFLREEGGDLVMQAAIGCRLHQMGGRLAWGEGVIGWVAENNVARLIPDVTVNQGYVESSFLGSGTMLVAPLLAEGRMVGVLVVENEMSDAFSIDDVRLAESIGPYLAAVIEVALLHEQAKAAASYDSLTGVFNHRYFYERLGQEIAHARRHGLVLSIAIIDVDGLKRINDFYGHLAGDEALRRMGHLLKENVRAYDVVARYGGDEFAIIMPETEREQAEAVITRLMLLLDRTSVEYEGVSFFMPPRSYGLAIFPSDGNNAIELFAVADAQLYETRRRRANA